MTWPGPGPKLDNYFRRIEDKKRNIQRSHLLVATVTLFILCWLPLNILNIAEDFDLPLRTWRYLLRIFSPFQLKINRYYYFSFFCFHLMSMSSTICNMLLYGWLNHNISSQSRIISGIKVRYRTFFNLNIKYTPKVKQINLINPTQGKAGLQEPRPRNILLFIYIIFHTSLGLKLHDFLDLLILLSVQ